MPEYPNPEFDRSKEELRNSENPTDYPDRKWSYNGTLDVWPTTPMAFPEHKDVWGYDGWKDYSQGHLWFDFETDKWNIFQWGSRPQGLSDQWRHPIQKLKKSDFQKKALEAVIQYVRENCHAEPVIADHPMPADDAGQAMYMQHAMKLISDEEMDRLRRQAGDAHAKGIFNPERDFTNEFTKNQYGGRVRFAYYVPTGEVTFSSGVSHNDLIYQLSKAVGRDLNEYQVYKDKAVKTGLIQNNQVEQGIYANELTPEENSHVQAAYNIWMKTELPEQDEDDYQNFFQRRWDKSAGYGDPPEPFKWDHLRDEIKDETDPTTHPNRKWSHTWGPNGYLDVWPVNDIAYPEHVDVWGGWGWENCSQGHLWYENGKWMIYPWQDRPHCMSRAKPKEAAAKDQFIANSTEAVVQYVRNVLKGEPEISNTPMPADSRGQAYYAGGGSTPAATTKKNPHGRNTPEFDITRIFNMYKFGDESIYWDKKKGIVYWYSTDPNISADMESWKPEFLNIPEVRDVQVSSKRPSGPWKKLASPTSDDLFNNLTVRYLDADEWGNSKSHVPGVYSPSNDTLYMADGPAHHINIIETMSYSEVKNSISIDFKNYDFCVIIAPKEDTPREYLEVLNKWAREERPGCQVSVEFNGDDETRLPFDAYIDQVYERGEGWDQPIPYCENCGEYGHTEMDHDNDDNGDQPWTQPPPSKQPDPFSIDWGAISKQPMKIPKIPKIQPTLKSKEVQIQSIKDQIQHLVDDINWYKSHGEVIDPMYGEPGYSKGKIQILDQKIVELYNDLHDLMIKTGAREFQVGDNVQAIVHGKNVTGLIKEIKNDGTYLVNIDWIDWLLQPESIKMIVPVDHQEKGWIIWYADERDEVEDQGLKPGGKSTIFTDQQEAEKAFSGLKNVDLWQVDMTGNDVYEVAPKRFMTSDKFYPEQLYLLYGPSNPPQKSKKKEFVNRWSYNIATGELLVSPTGTLPEDHWRTLNYPPDWLGGVYVMNEKFPQGKVTVIEKPNNLSSNKQDEYVQDVTQKLQTMPD